MLHRKKIAQIENVVRTGHNLLEALVANAVLDAKANPDQNDFGQHLDAGRTTLQEYKQAWAGRQETEHALRDNMAAQGEAGTLLLQIMDRMDDQSSALEKAAAAQMMLAAGFKGERTVMERLDKAHQEFTAAMNEFRATRKELREPLEAMAAPTHEEKLELAVATGPHNGHDKKGPSGAKA
ncbi:MAG: hypothetical protein M3O22_01540 [Pseudomonadota bacterium]|nr:hypothetical protein [Pseudomonadota bacterium]